MATIKVKHEVVEGNELGYVIIEEQDFDPAKHERYEEAEDKNEGPLSSLNKAELTKILTDKGVEVDPAKTKAQLLELIKNLG